MKKNLRGKQITSLKKLNELYDEIIGDEFDELELETEYYTQTIKNQYLLQNYNKTLEAKYKDKLPNFDFVNNEKPLIIKDKNKKIIFNKPPPIKKALVIYLEDKFKDVENINELNDKQKLQLFEKLLYNFNKEKNKYVNLETKEMLQYNTNLGNWEKYGFYSENIGDGNK